MIISGISTCCEIKFMFYFFSCVFSLYLYRVASGVRDIVEKEEALCLHMFDLKPEKFQITNEELQSGSHTKLWTTICTSARSDFLRNSCRRCGHSQFTLSSPYNLS